MPELPEVETLRRQLAPVLAGHGIRHVSVHRPRAVRSHPAPDEFVRLLTGRTILEVRRRGKALLMPLEDGQSLLARLGMSGRLLVVAPTAPCLPHTHVILTLTTGMALRFVDPRTFGEMAVVAGQDPAHLPELAHYGPEPLEEEFTVSYLQRALAHKRPLVQAVLMDQRQVVGIGNIYADEACFLAGIHPERAAGSLTADEVARLHAAIQAVLTQAIAYRGTSSLDQAYRDVNGQVGEYQHQLHVYQRANRPCRVCGTLIEYRPFQGRRLHFCPHCQQ